MPGWSKVKKNKTRSLKIRVESIIKTLAIRAIPDTVHATEIKAIRVIVTILVKDREKEGSNRDDGRDTKKKEQIF